MNIAIYLWVIQGFIISVIFLQKGESLTLRTIILLRRILALCGEVPYLNQFINLVNLAIVN